MPVQTKATLKSYFEDGKVPSYLKYVDLIDTMGLGDMVKSVYDIDDDGKVDAAEEADHALAADAAVNANHANSADNATDADHATAADAATYASSAGSASTAAQATNSDKLGGTNAVEYLKRTSANRPGVTRLYRRDADNAYAIETSWDGTYWLLGGYLSGSWHAGVRVARAGSAASADAVAWGNVTGKPSTYPPSSHTHWIHYHNVLYNSTTISTGTVVISPSSFGISGSTPIGYMIKLYARWGANCPNQNYAISLLGWYGGWTYISRIGAIAPNNHIVSIGTSYVKANSAGQFELLVAGSSVNVWLSCLAYEVAV